MEPTDSLNLWADNPRNNASAVRVGTMGDHNGQQRRIHHVINWRHCAAKIVRETVRKPRPAPSE
jgi:hypothetical protein